MKRHLIVSFVAGAGCILVLSGCGGPVKDGRYSAIAKCLTQKGVVFYGAFWCPHCQEQKAIFGNDAKYVNFVECDPRGENAKPEECRERGIERYPTWFLPGQGNLVGLHKPEDLAAKVGCTDAASQTQALSQQGIVMTQQ